MSLWFRFRIGQRPARKPHFAWHDSDALPSDCHPLFSMGSQPSWIVTDPRYIDVQFCSSIPLIDYLSLTTLNAKDFRWTPCWLHWS